VRALCVCVRALCVRVRRVCVCAHLCVCETEEGQRERCAYVRVGGYMLRNRVK
jgi:hypothetical protein